MGSMCQVIFDETLYFSWDQSACRIQGRYCHGRGLEILQNLDQRAFIQCILNKKYRHNCNPQSRNCKFAHGIRVIDTDLSRDINFFCLLALGVIPLIAGREQGKHNTLMMLEIGRTAWYAIFFYIFRTCNGIAGQTT